MSSPFHPHNRAARTAPPPAAIARRRFLQRAAVGAGAAAVAPLILGAESRAREPRLEPFDREMEEFMKARNVPGGALAVVKDRKLVYARGYGWADKEKEEPVQPASLFRIASLSKPITAVAVLRLVEQRRLKLDDRAFDYIDLEPHLPADGKVDERLRRITIRQCLQHTGGWDRDRSFDPMFRPVDFASALGKPPPASAADVIRNMLGLPLDFDPGQRYAYSNFGYCVLGRVLEKVTRKTYERFVKDAVLRPAGVKRMRIGASLEEGRAEDEVRYYMPNGEMTDSVFACKPGKVPWPYGGFHLEAMDAHGGWIASAVDLARFAAALDNPKRSRLLKPESFRLMYEPPPAPVSRNEDGSLKPTYYGLGWQVRLKSGASGRASYSHTGSLPGTRTMLLRRSDGVSWAVLFNQRQNIPDLPDSAIEAALHRAADAVTDWPKQDLFAHFA